jgi:glycosyltransferase involved in cell wall biosynthesis
MTLERGTTALTLRQPLRPATSRTDLATAGGTRIRVLFLVPQFSTGGAERQMVLLAEAIDKSRFDVTIAAMYPGGSWIATAQQIAGVTLRCLDKRGRYDVFGFLARLVSVVREARPDVVQTHGVSALFGLAAALTGRAALILGIRNARLDVSRAGWPANVMFSIGAHVSRVARLAIANSHAGRSYYAAHGYQAGKIRVVPNGFDTEAFAPSPAAGRATRQRWGIADDALLVGIVARVVPVKDHELFLRAAAIVAEATPRVRFAIIGEGSAAVISRLQGLAASLGISERVHWTGRCDDMVAAHSALDLCVSTSLSEGISNSIGEAMACGTPCAVTDAGDSALLLNDASRVSPIGQPEAAAGVWLRVLSLSADRRRALGAADRQRIVEHFSLPSAARQMETLIAEVAGRRTA